MSKLINVAKVPRNQSALMMYLADQVSRGYSMYISGLVTTEKAADFATKMNQKFEVDLTSPQRTARKRKGLPNFILIMFPLSDEQFIWYALTAGLQKKIEKIALANGEHFSDATERSSRIELKDYELKRVTKSKKAGGGLRWTWFLKPKMAKMLQEELITGARGRSNHKLEQAVARLRNRPMFSGVRGQVSVMFLKARLELKARTGHQESPEFLTKTLPFFGGKIKIFGD